MIQQVQPVHSADFSGIIGDQNLVTVSVGFDLSPVVLSLSQPPDYRTVASSGASFFKKRANKPNHFSIHYLVGDDWQRTNLEETNENFCTIQPLGRDHWLLVRGRAESEKDQNATVFDMDGRPQWSFHAGDGIEDVQTSENEEIWISYFDEGVFGDVSLGKAGLVCLDSHGKILYQYNDPTIADCYALNVCSARETWLYYYTDFPLVRLMDRRPDGIWRNLPVQGSHSFAVGHDRVLFCGSYDKRDRLILLSLESMSVVEIEVLDKFGQPLRSLWGIGRRSVLHLSTAEAMYRLDIDDL
jgi:hypothetical protein